MNECYIEEKINQREEYIREATSSIRFLTQKREKAAENDDKVNYDKYNKEICSLTELIISHNCVLKTMLESNLKRNGTEIKLKNLKLIN